MSGKFIPKVWQETITIPTYTVGLPGKNPIFSDHRVYQGSSGKVYPYPIIEKINDAKIEKEYTAIYLENEYLKVMVLPELGGRIHRAIDKTNNYDFLYHNHVIKPALVGLLGPWISGGIEFNWPQHHRPTTFMPVDYQMKTDEDGNVSVIITDYDRMYGTKVNTEFKLYSGKSFIEINAAVYNGTAYPQTFLWWANPAIPANEHTQSIFPPDVHAVMDHGKRDVSRFPIATGEYYKYDYSEGVDISFFKNIPVPTSYMAEKSKYDFMGGYDHNKNAGLLHVADHNISPGKKQWTWGNGDFGKAWDRNLTDDDGPYIELMTGVYTDNQPDFTWLKPYETKSFKQYFMPYKNIGAVKNSTIHAAVNLEKNEDEVTIQAYAMEEFKDCEIIFHHKETLIFRDVVKLSPTENYEKKVMVPNAQIEDLEIRILSDNQTELVSYQPEKKEIRKVPSPAKEAEKPELIMSQEELFLTGQHLEQYRHATFRPEDYYLEGLKRDPLDSRINNAYGALLYRRGDFRAAESHFRTAIKRLTWRNPNPYDSEAYYNLGLLLFRDNLMDEAYEAFFKATWTSELQDRAYYYLSLIDMKRRKYAKALELVNLSISRNTRNIKALGLKGVILRVMGNVKEASIQLRDNLAIDPFDVISAWELAKLSGEEFLVQSHKVEPVIVASYDYALMGCMSDAYNLITRIKDRNIMAGYYGAYYGRSLLDEQVLGELLVEASKVPHNAYFPNTLEDMKILEWVIDSNENDAVAPYLLGTLLYDKKNIERAREMWMLSARIDESMPTVKRNLALISYNHDHDELKALKYMEEAYELDQNDARILFELDQLYRKIRRTPVERLEHLGKHIKVVFERDDLILEYVSLLNMVKRHQEALEILLSHNFHPWEGGEGKATGQYKASLTALGITALKEDRLGEAKEYLEKTLNYPQNLGEGRLEGTKENDIHYYLGDIHERMGNSSEAHKHYLMATRGSDDPKGVMYYNDQPSRMILFQGMALSKLGRSSEAKRKYYKLLDYGEQHLLEEVSLDYFAVSLPDFLVYQEDWTKRSITHCHFLMGLAQLGFGDLESAEAELRHVLNEDPSHFEALMLKTQFL